VSAFQVAESASERDAIRARGMASVLVADDEDHLRRALCELLGEYGFDVVGEAANGRDAVDRCIDLAPDVALLDLRMPVLDGIGAARQIKERAPATQVVMLTAYDEDSLRTEAVQAGVYCYLVKGCGPGLIRDTLVRASAWSVTPDMASRPSSEALEDPSPYTWPGVATLPERADPGRDA
jgi:DNA-binding NarL/FixJ family response regulator